jgi:hypothetical protein
MQIKGYDDWAVEVEENKRKFDERCAEELNNFPIRQDITVLPPSNPQSLKVGWRIYEQVGICVVNDYAVSQITIDDDGEDYATVMKRKKNIQEAQEFNDFLKGW